MDSFFHELFESAADHLSDPGTWMSMGVDLGITVLIAVGGGWLALRRRRAQRRVKIARAWALATSAILTETNGDDHTRLSSLPLREGEAEARRILREWWGVDSREALLRTLDWLLRQGDREEATALQAALRGDGDASLLARAAPHRVQWVRDHADGHRELLAWDLCRLVSVARWAYGARYLSLDETWRFILDAGAALRPYAGSWAELGALYLEGRVFWRAEGQESTQAAYARLCDPANARSPWNQIPWAAGASLAR
jgi:hypothetical protein